MQFKYKGNVLLTPYNVGAGAGAGKGKQTGAGLEAEAGGERARCHRHRHPVARSCGPAVEAAQGPLEGPLGQLFLHGPIY